MLRKLQPRQIDGEPFREWIADDYFDLYVWHRPDGSILGFQLCYDKGGAERALTWMHPDAFRHERIDAGEASPFENRSPIMTQSCPFEREPVRTEFLRRSTQLEPELRDLVLAKLDRYPESPMAGAQKFVVPPSGGQGSRLPARVEIGGASCGNEPSPPEGGTTNPIRCRE
ncbi:MAG TPA: hypothetical protein VGO11_14250 [Chthoniobacteraceae bacterium]|jgi:hypothetical protein|nr:hypothetical protein [Chthoniobacteraceae bacterium]